MRVTFNTYSGDALVSLNQQASKQADLQVQISSGQKISRPDQDPLTAQKILKLQSANTQSQQYYQNAGYALDISKASFTAIDQVRAVSDRIGELTSGISGITSADNLEADGKEVNTLIEQSVAAMNQMWNGGYLFGGTKSDTAPFTVTRDAQGQVTGVSYVGAAQGASMQVANNVSITPYTNGATNQAMGDFINKLVALRDSMQGADAEAVVAQRQGLHDSEGDILVTLSEIGSQQSRLESAQDMLSTQYDDGITTLSNYNDVDLSKALVDLTKSQTAYQAGLQATAKIMSNSLLDYVK